MTFVIFTRIIKGVFCIVKSEQTEKLECSHCHQPVADVIYGRESGQVYCCYGCKVVDELLRENANLISKGDIDSEKYRYLEAPKIRSRILNFEDGHFARVKLHLPAIHCSSCIYLLENLPQVEEGFLDVMVHFSRKQATVAFRSDKLSLAQVAALLDFIGYAPDFQTDLGQGKKVRNNLVIKLGVAGFFFGNTMLLALPEYLDTFLAREAHLQHFFRYLMMAFSLPVVLYSGRDYFTNALKSLRAGFLSIDLPIALGITVLFARSAYEVLSGVGAGYFDSLNGLVFFLLIGKWYQQKTYENFTFDRDLRSFLPLAANKILKNGTEKSIAIDDLDEGDEIRVRQGEILPADARLLRGDTQVDYSYLTGESAPLLKKQGDTVFAGARLIGRAGSFTVLKSVDRSYLSSLWAQDSFKDQNHKKELSQTDKISRYFTPAILLLALAAGAYWSLTDWAKAINVFTAVLIVACPCALALAEPFANGSMMRWFGRHGFFLKNSEVISRLPKINHIVFDKTGTLTQQDSVEVSWHGTPLDKDQKTAVAAIAQNAQHPLAQPLLQFLGFRKTPPELATHFEEASGEGVTAVVNDVYFRLGKASFLNISDEAHTTAIYLEVDGQVMGHFSFHQKVRKALASVLFRLNAFQLSLLSGDNAAEEQRFSRTFPAGSNLVFNQSPHQKLAYLKGLQAKNEKVLMLGDGLNDAGALQQSEVGISLCEKNVNFFPASDALLQAEAFARLPHFMALSQINRQVIYAAFGISLLYNLVGLSFAMVGLLSPVLAAILMPVSSVTIVLFTTTLNRFFCAKRL